MLSGLETSSQRDGIQEEINRLKTRIEFLEGVIKDQCKASCHVCKDMTIEPGEEKTDYTTIVVFGASGDLAKRKTYPALYNLLKKGLMNDKTIIIGYGRSPIDLEVFRKQISTYIRPDDAKEIFLRRCYYFNGAYDDTERFMIIDSESRRIHGSLTYNIILYFAVPPSVFETVANLIVRSGLKERPGWTRLIIEKPFGFDLDSSNSMNMAITKYFDEAHIFRIDHYLGKDMVQNMMVLRFANLVWEPIWNNHHISNVLITFKEDIGTGGRAGYFNKSGIIRDVMQNHLMQILSLVAMEPPVSLNPDDIRNEKVKVLRSCSPIREEDIVIGQYGRSSSEKYSDIKAYLEEDGVPPDSITPTFAMAVLHINNVRWSGVPFILKCGKGLNQRKAEIRIQFKEVGTHLYSGVAQNELVFLVQPREAIYLKLMGKIPGLTDELVQSELDLSYAKRYHSANSADAYERLILDVLKGDQNLFVRSDELQAAWNIITPILNHLENKKEKPIIYEYGTRGPSESDMLAYRFGWKRNAEYEWRDHTSPDVSPHLSEN